MNLHLNYINVPLLLQYNFANGFRAQGGPQVGFLTSAKGKEGGSEVPGVNTANFKSAEVSLPIGLSYLGLSGFGVDARFNLGLTNISQTTPPTMRNNVFQVGAFYLFDHQHKSKSAVRSR
jgi:hypothetical protein